MTVAPSVKKRCSKCQIIRRKKRATVICLTNKRHAQRQG